MFVWGGGGGYVCVYRFCIIFHFLLTCFLIFFFSNIESRRLLPRVTTCSGVPSLFKSYLILTLNNHIILYTHNLLHC